MKRISGHHVLFGITLMALAALGSWWTVFFLRAIELEKTARLDDLVPAFLDKVPQDLFDGKPMRYITQSRRYIVYSIGKDRTDDGGKERPPRRRGPGS